MFRTALTEDQARFWNTVFAGVTAVGLVAGGLYTVVQYLNGRKAAQENLKAQQANFALQLTLAQMEAKKPFYSKQLELCDQATAAAGVLATKGMRDKAEVKRAEGQFWQLYWGPLGVVEAKDVEGAMVEFGRCLRGNCEGKSLEVDSLELAHACRDLISASWTLDLPQLDFSEKKKAAQEDTPRVPPGR